MNECEYEQDRMNWKPAASVCEYQIEPVGNLWKLIFSLRHSASACQAGVHGRSASHHFGFLGKNNCRTGSNSRSLILWLRRESNSIRPRSTGCDGKVINTSND